jgi:uncharacterized protein YyaL (SSP411 family)
MGGRNECDPIDASAASLNPAVDTRNPISPTARQMNRLSRETSPYLQQHAHNPVDWYPWGAAALDTARREDKPVLLSIGYSACHWCHVMAHESFEDPDTARLMNDNFVNIKVDREERPDLDKIYQLAHQLLTQRGGGWPLTMFLTPDQVPFFGGTYFPNVSRYGLPDFKEILRRVAEFYRAHRAEIDTQKPQVIAALEQFTPQPPAGGAALSDEPLDLSRNQLGQAFDRRHGGFGDAPKFPHPPHLAFLLRHWGATALTGAADETALEMVTVTLDHMADGGIYDQLGGGFCRYSVDPSWTIPHFEKMLYDNAQLLVSYTEACRVTGRERYRQVIHETARWVLAEMQSPAGGYYSTLDADSEGHEGEYYVWDRAAVAAVLNTAEYQAVAKRYGLDLAPNFEGRWHLRVARTVDQVSGEMALPAGRVTELLDDARAKLLRAREARVRPGRDEKTLTAWNGLMIKGMAAAGRYLNRPDYVDSAQRALDFVQTVMTREGRLLATFKDGTPRFTAYLDDYVFMMDAILELLQARWRDGDLRFAVALAEVLLAHFEDRDGGGFFFTADDHETLIQRPKPAADDALPAGNGVAAQVLVRLGHLLGESRYLAAAERALTGLWSAVTQAPYAHNSLLLGLDEILTPPELIILRGTDAAMAPWLARCHARYAPRRLVFAVPLTASDTPGHVGHCVPVGPVVAYVCRDVSCSPPVTRLSELETLLKRTEPSTAGAA